MKVLALLNHFPYAGLFLVLVVGGLGFPFPEGVTLIIGGFLLSAGILQPVAGLIVAFLGVLTGDFISYFLGRKYGREIVSMKMFRRVLPPKKFPELEKKFNDKGAIFIFFVGRLISGVFLVAGVLKMSFKKIIILDIFSALLAIVIWVGIGYAGGNSLGIIAKDLKKIQHVAILAAVLFLVVWLFYRYFSSGANRSR